MENVASLHTLVHNTIDGSITDDIGAIENSTPYSCKPFSYVEQEVLGLNFSMLIPATDREHQDYFVQGYMSGKKGHLSKKEIATRTKKGCQFPLKRDVREINYSGRTIYAGFINDLTQQKANEKYPKNYTLQLEELVEERTKMLNDTITSLKKSKEKLRNNLVKEKELSKLKDQFLAMASHEFRTPLSTMQLSASLIEKYAEPLGDKNIQKHVLKIENAVSSLSAMLTDFLIMEQLETNTVRGNPTLFNLKTFAEEITEEMQVLIEGKQKIHFTHKCLQTQIYLDHKLLKNSIINLITNAIKYSGESCCIEFTTEINATHCIICITDYGIGIPAEDQEHLFEPFFRAYNTGTIPGTGLGLYIVTRYILLMNGKIEFTSKVEKGTVFTLSFLIS